jgi:hypothetical protein
MMSSDVSTGLLLNPNLVSIYAGLVSSRIQETVLLKSDYSLCRPPMWSAIDSLLPKSQPSLRCCLPLPPPSACFYLPLRLYFWPYRLIFSLLAYLLLFTACHPCTLLRHILVQQLPRSRDGGSSGMLQADTNTESPMNYSVNMETS